MGQRRLARPQGDDSSKKPTNQQKPKSNNSILNATNTRRGEVFRAQRRTSEGVNLRASQHIINVPVNKSIYNGYEGKQFSLVDAKRQPSRQEEASVKIIPLGGLGENGIGKNMMAIEYKNDIVVIDAGFFFPGPDYPGINYIVPDISYLLENQHKLRGIVFTHGHLDHIGGARHILSQLRIPVLASRFTLAMVKRIMEESSDEYTPEYIEVNPEEHEKVQLGESFEIELVRVNHSIPDATAVVIRTPHGVLLNTGDWRFEDKPIDGVKFDLERMTEIASTEGIMLLMNDSTSCEIPGTNTDHDEFDVQQSIGQIMQQNTSSRIIVSTFSSQLHRLQVVMEEAQRYGRKVAIAGFSMIQNIEVAVRTGTIKIPKDTVIKMEEVVKLPDSKVIVLCTGSQGEFTAVLNRMASGAHKYLKVKGTDVVVFSSSVVPGNQKYVTRTIDGLMREGSEVMQDRQTHLTGVGRIHLGGHGHYDDQVKFIDAINPTYYMPIHGEFHMLVHSARMAEKECNIPRSRIFVCDNGDILELNRERQMKKTGRIPVGGVMYDDAGEIVSEVVLKDRIHMSQEGMFVVVLTIARGSGRLLTSPDIISRGFIYLRDNEELMGMIRAYLKQKSARAFAGKYDIEVVKKEIKDEVTHILYDQTRRTPIVIPVINEVGVQGGRSQQNTSRSSTPQRVSLQQPRRGEQFPKKFPQKQYPDTEVIEPQIRSGGRSY